MLTKQVPVTFLFFSVDNELNVHRLGGDYNLRIFQDNYKVLHRNNYNLSVSQI